MWYKATDKLNSYIRVVMLDFSKALDLINHHLLLDTLWVWVARTYLKMNGNISIRQSSTNKNRKLIFLFWSSQWGSTARYIVSS